MKTPVCSFTAFLLLFFFTGTGWGQSIHVTGGSASARASISYWDYSSPPYPALVSIYGQYGSFNPLTTPAVDHRSVEGGAYYVKANYSWSQTADTITTSIESLIRPNYQAGDLNRYMAGSDAALQLNFTLDTPGILSIATSGPAGMGTYVPLGSSGWMAFQLEKVEGTSPTRLYTPPANLLQQLSPSTPYHGPLFDGALEAGTYRISQLVSSSFMNLAIKFTPVPVPEPSSGLLVLASGVGLVCFRRRRNTVKS